MESAELYMLIRVSTMASGSMAKSKEKECTFIKIRMYFLVIGWMEKNMGKEHTYLMPLEWNISGNGIKTNFWMENGLIQTEHIFRENFKITNQKGTENGTFKTEIAYRENTIR
jgi:hypothetical protein